MRRVRHVIASSHLRPRWRSSAAERRPRAACADGGLGRTTRIKDSIARSARHRLKLMLTARLDAHTVNRPSGSARCSWRAQGYSDHRPIRPRHERSFAVRLSSASITSTRRSTTGPTSSTRSSGRRCTLTRRGCGSCRRSAPVAMTGAGCWPRRTQELRAGVEANLRTLRVNALALVNLRLMGPETRADPDGGATRRAHGPARRGQDRVDRGQQRLCRRGRLRPLLPPSGRT
jgi:hypothetical protein